MRQGFTERRTRTARFRLGVLVAACALVAVGALASSSSAAYRANSVVAVFCTSDTIPAGSQLQLRMRWGTSTPGQLDKFLAHQNMTWEVQTSDGSQQLAVGATPSPLYGDLTNWVGTGSMVGTVTGANGKPKTQKYYYADWLVNTGYTVALNQTVRVAYELSADVATDDGFGFKFDAGVLSSGSSCNVTGANPPPA